MYLFFDNKEIAKDEIDKYIQDSNTITISNFRIKEHKLHYNYAYSFFRKKNANGNRSKEYILIEDLERKKYFMLDFYNGTIFLDTTTLGKNKIHAKVNNKDLCNPNLGNPKKPIHLLFFYIDENHKNNYITQKQYLINTKEYLTYEQ